MVDQPSTALLVIDVQESFRQRPDDWAAMANPAIIENVTRLVNAARSNGDLVVWIVHSEPNSGDVFDPAQGFVRLVEELAPLPDEPRITKTSVNAFTTTDLAEQLQSRGVETVVICGIRTDQCCETTARVASDLGFEVVFVTDATTTSGIPANGDLAALSGKDLMARTESILSAREFATITTTQRWANSRD
jgi:nicotinamidase-related amidase